jgi:hypothetical protein
MARRSNPLNELWLFMRANKAYWLLPMVVALVLLGVLLVLGQTSAAPFIYTLF